MSPRVFVVQERTDINLTPALDYGELIFMLPPGQHSFNPQRMGEAFKDSIEKNQFTSDDYLLLLGDPVAIASASIYIATWLGEPPLKVLKWDRQTRQYTKVEI